MSQQRGSLAESFMLGQQLAPQGGSEFLQRRLQRARAVPAAERSPEVAAFVESSQLFQEAAELLPVAFNGSLQLPFTERTLLRVLVGTLKILRAHYVAPDRPISDVRPNTFVAHYLHLFRQEERVQKMLARERAAAVARERGTAGSQAGSSGGAGSNTASDSGAGSASSGGYPELLQLLTSCFGVEYSPDQLSVFLGSAAEQQLEQPGFRQAVECQLAALPAACQRTVQKAEEQGRESGDYGPPCNLSALLQPPPMTLEQLLHGLHCRVSSNAQVVLEVQGNTQMAAQLGVAAAEARLPASEVARLRQVAAHHARAAAELEPGNPKGALAVALAVPHDAPAQQQADSFLHAFQVAQQHGSDYFMAAAAGRALVIAAHNFGQVSVATLEAAVAAVQQAGPAYRRFKRLLPEAWVESAAAAVSEAEQFAASAELQLQYHQQQQQQQQGQQQLGQQRQRSAASRRQAGGRAPAVTLEAVRQSVREAFARCQQAQVEGISRFSRCDGCGKMSYGLRRCSRCKAAQYCSRECQVEHWKKHKPHCHADS